MNTARKMHAGVGLLLALALGASQPAQAQPHRFSEQEEVDMGYETAMQLERAYGVLPADHPMSRRVRALGAQFARLTQRRHLPYTYKVLLDDRGINAATCPGGFIYIFRGAVNAASNDAELAYVIGHETAHADRRHTMTALEKASRRAMLADLATAMAARKRSPRDRLLIGVAAQELLKAAYFRRSRKDEDDADRYAVRWMSRLGYDPRGASAMLGKFPLKARRDLYEETHPDPRERQRSVQGLIAAEGLLAAARRAGGPRLFGARHPRLALRSTELYRRASAPARRVYVFHQPLLLQDAVGARGVLMVSALEFARWAGAATVYSRDETRLHMRRGNVELAFPMGSRRAYLNGRAITMPGATEMYGTVGYVPFEVLARAFNVRFSVVRKQGAVGLAVELPGRATGVIPA